MDEKSLDEKPKAYVVLYFLLGLAAVIRFRWAYVYNPVDDLISDAQRHWGHGYRVLGEGPLAAFDPIGFQLWMGAILRLTLGDRLACGIYAGLLSVLTPWLWYRFFRELLPERSLALFGWLLISLSPIWMSIFCHFMPETLLLPLEGLALWLTWRERRRRSLSSFTLMVIAWVLTFLTKSSVAPLAIIAVFSQLRRPTETLQRVGILGGILATVFLPLIYRVYLLISLVVPAGVSMGLQSLYFLSGRAELRAILTRDGNEVTKAIWISPELRDRPFAPFSDWKSSREGVGNVRIELSAGSRDWDKAKLELSPGISVRVRMVMENIIFLLFGNSWPEWHEHRFWDWALSLFRWCWVPMILLSLSLQISYRREREDGTFLLLLHLLPWLVFFFAPVSVAEGRVRKPLEGIVLAALLWSLSVYRQKTVVKNR